MRPLQCVEKSLAPFDEGAVCDSLNAALWAVARLHGACGHSSEADWGRDWGSLSYLSLRHLLRKCHLPRQREAYGFLPGL